MERSWIEVRIDAKAGKKVFLIHPSDLGLVSPKGTPLSVRMRHPDTKCQEKTAAAMDPVAHNMGKKPAVKSQSGHSQ
jgi:hypothetical protein